MAEMAQGKFDELKNILKELLGTSDEEAATEFCRNPLNCHRAECYAPLDYFDGGCVPSPYFKPEKKRNPWMLERANLKTPLITPLEQQDIDKELNN